MITIEAKSGDVWKSIREVLVSDLRWNDGCAFNIPREGLNIRLVGVFTKDDKDDAIKSIAKVGLVAKVCEVYVDSVVQEESRMEVQIVHKTIS